MPRFARNETVGLLRRIFSAGAVSAVRMTRLNPFEIKRNFDALEVVWEFATVNWRSKHHHPANLLVGVAREIE